MNEEFENNSSIDTELQVRLMSLVMGEASDFERDQLQAMMEQRPELLAYCRHLEHLHGLLCEVGAGEPSMELEATDSQGEWRLPAEQREKLLAVLDSSGVSPSSEVNPPTTPVRLASSVSTKIKSYMTRRWLSGLAVAAASLLLGFMIFPRNKFGKQFLTKNENSSFIGGTTSNVYFDQPASALSPRYEYQAELNKRIDPTDTKSIEFGERLSSGVPAKLYLLDDVDYYVPSAPAVSSSPSKPAGPPASVDLKAKLEKVKTELSEMQMASQISQLPAVTPYYRADVSQFGFSAAPAVDAPTRGLSRLSEDRLSRGRQSGLVENGRATVEEKFAKPGSGSDFFADGQSSLDRLSDVAADFDKANGGSVGFGIGGGSAESTGGTGGMGGMGGGMGGMGMGSGMSSPPGAPTGEGFGGRGGGFAENSSGQVVLGDGRELAERESVRPNMYTNQGLGFGSADIPLEGLFAQSDQSGEVQRKEKALVEGLSDVDRAASPIQPQAWSIENPSEGWADSTFADLGNNSGLGVPLPAYETPVVDGDSQSAVAVVPVESAPSTAQLEQALPKLLPKSAERSQTYTVQVPNTSEVEVPYTVSVPDGGSITLGGITRSYDKPSNGIDQSSLSSLLRTVTPSIIIQDEEEAKLGVVDGERPLISEAELDASESRIKMNGKDSPSTSPRIDVRRDGEGRGGEAKQEPGRVNWNTAKDPSILADLFGANETAGLSMGAPYNSQETPSGSESAALEYNFKIVRDGLKSQETIRQKLAELPEGILNPPNDVVPYPSAEQWQELSKRRKEKYGSVEEARDLDRSIGSGEAPRTGKGENDLALLDANNQAKQQAQQDSVSDKSKNAIDSKAVTNGPQSQLNTEWYGRQIAGFQAANGNGTVTNEQLEELKKRVASEEWERSYRTKQDLQRLDGNKNEPIDSPDLATQFLFFGNTQGQPVNPEKRLLEASKDVAPEVAPQASAPEASTPALNPADPTGHTADFGTSLSKNAPSPEAIASSRNRFVRPPVTAGKPAEVKLDELEALRVKAVEAKANSEASKLAKGLPEFEKQESGKTISPKPAQPKAEELARGTQQQGLTRGEKRPSIDEQSASKEAFSTFSLHVSDVSFKLAQAALSQGQWPEAAKIRVEEFVNALDYRDPLPCGNERVACRIEQAIHPFMMQRNLLRVSMRTAATGRSQNTPLRLTILLDNSGSMERHDRRQAVLRAFQTLTSQLKASDQVTLISFASTPRLLADKVAGNQGETLLQLIESLPSEGGTNIESALMLAREKAAEQQLAGAQNRIVLLTDGAVNLGNANPESLSKLVTGLRDSGIAFDAAGISAHDLNDEVLEALTRQGDGRYYLLDSAQSANESFAAQIAGALRPSAQNVKVQVEFNPQRVGRYKLLGYEKHRLNKEDFRNDKVDAAEMAAAEAGVAVYQFEVKPNGSGDVGSVSVRFLDLATGKMVENRWPIPYEANAPRLEQAEPSMKLAASAALLAAKLSGGPLGDNVDLSQLQKLVTSLPEQVASQTRVQQLRSMIEQASGIK